MAMLLRICSGSKQGYLTIRLAFRSLISAEIYTLQPLLEASNGGLGGFFNKALNGPGAYLKPASNRGPAFINEVFFFCHFIKLIYYHPTSESQAKFVKTGRFSPSSNLTNFPWVFSYSRYSIQNAYHRMLRKRCVKKKTEHKQYMHNIEAC